MSVHSDFSVSNQGNIFMVYPKSDDAREWVQENVGLEGWQWLGGGFAVDQHMIEHLIDGMAEAGLVQQEFE